MRDIVAELRRFAATDKAPPDVFDLGDVLQAAIDWVARAQMPELDVQFDLPGRSGPSASLRTPIRW